MKHICFGKSAPFLQVCKSAMHKQLLLYYSLLWCCVASSCHIVLCISRLRKAWYVVLCNGMRSTVLIKIAIIYIF